MQRECCQFFTSVYLAVRFAHNLDRLEGDTLVNPNISTVSGFWSGAVINEAGV